MAREDLWIIADNHSVDKMVKFHQLKNLASTDLALGQWYLFSHFDIHSQTAKAFGNAFQQLERGLLNTMKERPRPPHSIILLLGDSLLTDKVLSFNPQNLFVVLHGMLKQLKCQVKTYIDLLPTKAKPLQDIRLMITKPLPKPEKFYKNNPHKLAQLAKARHIYNDKLVAAIKLLNMNFINPGIQPSNTRAFTKTNSNDKEDMQFVLTPEGLHQFWYSISSGLEKLHKGLIGTQAHCTSTTNQFG